MNFTGLIIVSLLIGLVGISCSFYSTTSQLQQDVYPHPDSVFTKYTILYFNKTGDSTFAFTTYTTPVEFLTKDSIWATFFYSINGKPIVLKDGTYTTYKQYGKIVKEYIDKKEKENNIKIQVN